MPGTYTALYFFLDAHALDRVHLVIYITQIVILVPRKCD